MDNIRLILIMALFFILFLLYQAWQQDYGPKPPPPTTTGKPTDTTATPSTITSVSELPSVQEESSHFESRELPQSQVAVKPLTSHSQVTVETDLLKVELDTMGGDIRRVYLKAYPLTVETPDDPFRLMNDSLPNFFIAQSGLLSQQAAPTHQQVYHSQDEYYQLSPGAESLPVTLTWESANGLRVKKIYTFKPNSYVIELTHQVDNQTGQPWEGRLYTQLQRTKAAEVGQSSFIHTYMGGAVATPNSLYKKVYFDDMRDGSFNQENPTGWAGGWAAMLQHYFLAAWVPQPEEVFRYSGRVFGENRYALQMVGPLQTVAPNAQQDFSVKLFAGPKLQYQLGELAPGLDLTVDYGWLWFIAQPLYWTLEWIYRWIGNWGWAIIILTLLIKLAFYQLSATSYKSMAHMRRLHPRLVALKERYGDNKEGLNRAMMDLYKKEKINPLGGCLPILVQIPVFIALYWVLLESVELRHAPFIFWINDLSSPDPFFVLPVIMGVTMLLQHYLNPTPIDPVQQKVMLILPLVFTVFFAFFPSGLVLYWVVNNMLSIAQQWIITRQIAGDV
jgi:YidC/Oxa1 family membrane protein insertase